MLQFQMVTPDILEVTETQMTFTTTTRRYFYTDIFSWESLTSPRAAKQNVADGFKYRREMTDAEREWCQKHYLPKVKPFSEDNSK